MRNGILCLNNEGGNLLCDVTKFYIQRFKKKSQYKILNMFKCLFFEIHAEGIIER